MELFSLSTKEEVVLMLDISSGAVSGAIFLKDAKKLPFILASAVKHFRIGETLDPARLQKELFLALDQVCLELQRSVGIRPGEIYCVLGNPWSHGELRSIKISRDKDFKFTEAFAQKLVHGEISKFQKDNLDNSQIIDKKITKVSLNGYTVKSPHGQKTTSVGLDVFLSVSPASVVEALEDRIHKTFKSRIFFTSQMLADFVFARDLLSAPKDFLVLNIGAEITEVAVSHADHMSGTAFFPFGTNTMLRTIAAKLQKNLGETQSLFRLCVDGSLADTHSAEIEKSANFATDMWQSSLKQILLEMLPNRHIPHRVFLSVEKDFSDWFASRMTAKFFPEFTTGNLDFNVIIGSIKNLHDFYDKSETAKPDANMVTKTIYINQM